MTCKIQVSTSGTISAGSVITGELVCTFRDSENIEGVSITLKGKEKVSWYQNKTTYRGKNTFLLDGLDLAPEGRIGPGIVKFSFMFLVPKNIPSSYVGQHGYIKYTLRAKVHKSFLSYDYKDKLEINVKSPIDLNQIADKSVLRPGAFKEKKTVYYCCIPGGQIYMQVNLEKRAFVPGAESIKIGVKIWNKTSLKITYLKAAVKTFIEVEVQGTFGSGTNMQCNSVSKIKEKGFASRSEKEYELNLPLPLVEVPNFINCKFFSVTHRLFVFAGLPGCHIVFVKYIDLCLADIPLQGSELPVQESELHVPDPVNTSESSALLVFEQPGW